MGENTGIEWCHHTFNPWRGCTKISEGCRFCYAEERSKRNLPIFGQWGPDGTRVVAAESTWRQPLAWDRKAQKAGTRARVFCASLADVFEDRPDLVAPRARLFSLIASTPHLDWLLLTKRPENIAGMLPDDWGAKGWPNAWLGTSVEDQEAADKRIPELLRVPAAVRFLSCEPLLGCVDLARWLTCQRCAGTGLYDLLSGTRWGAVAFRQTVCLCRSPSGFHSARGIDWAICGGESGPNARPMHPDWARDLRDQCKRAGVPFLMKQWGAWRTFYDRADDPDWERVPYLRGDPRRRWLNLAGGHGFHGERVVAVERVGKKAAGRLLDGEAWNQIPESPAAR